MTSKSTEIVERMNPAKRRNKARLIRNLIRDGIEATKAAERHGVSRAHCYRMLDELVKWEESATFQQEADDLHQDPMFVPYFGGEKWGLVSGRMIIAYRDGEITNAILNGQPGRESDIAVEAIDPLME